MNEALSELACVPVSWLGAFCDFVTTTAEVLFCRRQKDTVTDVEYGKSGSVPTAGTRVGIVAARGRGVAFRVPP